MYYDVFQEIKDNVSLYNVVSDAGFEINNSGFALCPFHNDTKPSLKIYEDAYHCFVCEAHGSAIDFVKNIYNISIQDAIKKLDNDYGLGLTDYEMSSEEIAAIKAKRLKRLQEKEYVSEKILELAQEHCRLWNGLKNSEEWSGQWVLSLQRLGVVEAMFEQYSELRRSL